MKTTLLCLLFLVAVGLEFLVHVPVVLLFLIGMSVMQSREWVFIVAVLLGVVLDSMFFRLLGATSIYFLCVIGLLFLYTRKFETANIFFGMLFAFLASVGYIAIFSPQQFIPAVLTSCVVGIAGFSSFYALETYSRT